MATVYWTGNAKSVAQVTNVTYSSVVATNTYSVLINGKAISYVALSTSAADLATALSSAWNASSEPEHQELTASTNVGTLILTARLKGVPCSVTATATTGSATVTTATSASGPNFWNVATNWTATPAGGDTLVIESSDIDILYGLTDTANYAALTIKASYTGAIGLPVVTKTGYAEYRTRYLTIGDGSTTGTITIGEGVGRNAERIYIDANGTEATIVIYGSTTNTTEPPIEIVNADTASTVKVFGGRAKFTCASAETFASVAVINSGSSAAYVDLGSTITTTLLTLNRATADVRGTVTTLNAFDASTATVSSAASIGTAKVGGRSTIDWRSTGGVTTLLDVSGDGTATFNNGSGSVTVAAVKLRQAGTLLDSQSRVTWTAGIVLEGTRLDTVKLDIGHSKTVGVS